MLTPSMIEGRPRLFRQSLDQRFGEVTTGAKMTDVPGHTRGMMAPLAKHEVPFPGDWRQRRFHPGQIAAHFPWKDPSGASLPVMYHANYGAIARVPGSDLVVVTDVRGDNSGPHTAEEIAHIHANLAARFPRRKSPPPASLKWPARSSRIAASCRL